MRKRPHDGVSNDLESTRRASGQIRLESKLRFTAVRPDAPESGESVGSQGPSTLPPPPFQNEIEVPENEWWLELHMELAGNLLCLEQSVDSVRYTESTRATLVRVQTIAEEAGRLRDSLYDLYCDAADPRMKPWTATGTALASYVDGLYRWCGAVVTAHVALTSSLRTEQRVTSIDALQLREALERVGPLLDEAAGEAIPESLRALGIDETNPIEPLRNLYKNLEELFFVAASLRLRVTQASAS